MGGRAVEDEKSGDECSDGAEDQKDSCDALAGADEWVGDGEGFGFGGFVVEPGGDEEDHAGERGKDVVLLPGGEGEEKDGDDGPEAEEEEGAFALCERADRNHWAEGFVPGDGGEGTV